MNTKYINIILAVIIVFVIGTMGFFGWRMWGDRFNNGTPAPSVQVQEPQPITNKGKESEDRDAALESDVRAINDAVIVYAKDHKGMYPESDFKNPCAGVSYCLKGVNINSKKKLYLPVIPQTQHDHLDYYYRADNVKKSYCIVTPSVLETNTTKVFQCTEKVCDLVLAQDMCQ